MKLWRVVALEQTRAPSLKVKRSSKSAKHSPAEERLYGWTLQCSAADRLFLTYLKMFEANASSKGAERFPRPLQILNHPSPHHSSLVGLSLTHVHVRRPRLVLGLSSGALSETWHIVSETLSCAAPPLTLISAAQIRITGDSLSPYRSSPRHSSVKHFSFIYLLTNSPSLNSNGKQEWQREEWWWD